MRVPRLVSLAQAVFLLEHRQTDIPQHYANAGGNASVGNNVNRCRSENFRNRILKI